MDVTTATSATPTGLRVVSVALPHLHTVTLVAYVKVGSRFESPGDNGLSHFVEHMLYRGTERYPTSLDLNFAIERLGCTLHAETGRDYSLYQLSFEPGLLGEALELFGEIFARPRFSEIELERNLILEELNEDYDEQDTEINGDDIARGLLFGDHPLGQRIIGSRANVRGFTEADIRRHFATYYCAENMLLCAAGPVDHAEVVAAANRHLGDLGRGGPATPPPAAFGTDGPRYKYVSDPGSQTSVHVLFQGIPEASPQYVAFIAMLRALDDGMSTRLHYELSDQRGLAYSVNASIEPLADATLFEITGSSAHAKIPEFLSRMLGLVGSLRDEKISDEELAKIKRRYRYEILSAVDDANAMAGWFGGSALYFAPPGLQARLAQMEAITAADILEVAKLVITPERLAVAVVGALSRARQGETRDIVLGFK